MRALDASKAAALLFLAAVVQISMASAVEVAEGHPDVVLVLLVCTALLRGAAFGALAGFWAGLVLDVASLETLGLSSLLLTLAGYWSGRFGEVTSRSSAHRPVLTVAFATVAVAVGSLVLHFMLGTAVSVGTVLVGFMLPTLALNVLLSYPLYALCHRLFPAPTRERREVSFAG